MLSHKGDRLNQVNEIHNKFNSQVIKRYVHSLSFIWYFAPGWGFLTTFDEHTPSHPLTRIFAPWSNPHPLPAIPSPPPPTRGLHW